MSTNDSGEHQLSLEDIAALAQEIGTADSPGVYCAYFLSTLAADSSEHDRQLAFEHAKLCNYCRPRVLSRYSTPDEAPRGTA
jgi:hypothetical protein